MARYNQWMNHKLYDLCGELTDEQRKRDVGAFFKSIHGTLNHLLVADRIWMARFTSQPFPGYKLDQQLYDDFNELKAAREFEDVRILNWMLTQTEQDLSGNLHYTSIANPQPRTTPLWLALSHFFNHQTHHRGQITTLLMQQGIDPGVTDLMWLPDPPQS